LKKHKHADLRMEPSNLRGCDEALVDVRGRHLDVGDRDVRVSAADLAQELLCVRGHCDYVETAICEEPRKPFPDQDGVVGDDDSQRRLGYRGGDGSRCGRRLRPCGIGFIRRERVWRREDPRQVGHDELVHVLRPVEVLQPMLAEVLERHVGKDVVGEHGVRRAREERGQRRPRPWPGGRRRRTRLPGCRSPGRSIV
jgi:hypothetical protein